jgi:hypothetical protein
MSVLQSADSIDQEPNPAVEGLGVARNEFLRLMDVIMGLVTDSFSSKIAAMALTEG